MPHGIDNLIGKKFGQLTVTEYIGKDKHYHHYWKCVCDCGNNEPVNTCTYNLTHGLSTSCRKCSNAKIGRANTKHGLVNDPLYSKWLNMRRRCNDKNHEHYGYYGGRGITICEEWENFENFYVWAINNGYESGLTIDREDVNGNYCPENCRWADNITQANNKTVNNLVTYNGITKTVAQWARLFDIKYETLRQRVKRGNMRDFEDYFGA